ncbi:MAG: zinc-dependent alcohol dehydrogenase [Planctomycetota bacterium]
MPEQQTMRAVYVESGGRFVVRQVPVPRPAEGEVLLSVRSLGICGTDLHLYDHLRGGQREVEEPFMIGHEVAGQVVELGREVTTLAKGDMVALEAAVPCGHCAHCRGGRYNLCPEKVFVAGSCEYLTFPEDFAHKLPEGVSAEEGTLLEPLAVGLHAVRRVGLVPGERALVLGAGPVGLSAVAAAVAAGAAEVAAVDLYPVRLEAARRLGATLLVNAREEDPADVLGEWADAVLDCVGSAQTTGQALQAARPGGRVGWVGRAAEEAPVNLAKAQDKELLIVGVFCYTEEYGLAVRLLAAGRVDLSPFITHRFPFPRIEEALRFAADNRAQALKTVVNFE